MLHLVFLFFIHLSVFSFAYSQSNDLLLCGPMLGYVEHREAMIWLEVSPKVKQVDISYFKHDDPAVIKNVEEEINSTYDFIPIKFILSGLDMNSIYDYKIFLNGEEQQFDFPLKFKTKAVWEYRAPAPDFSFVFGSCAYINDSLYDRPGEPYGRNPQIFESMAQQHADFNLWLGDNMYLREADFTSRSGIYYRYTHDRSIPELKELLASRSNFAIWDDHDYGPNNAGSSFTLKETSVEAFEDFWCNPSFGEPNNSGIYTEVNWSDCDFFLMDGRFYRSDERWDDSSSDKHYLGRAQLLWLENALLESEASFKFICMGSQVLNPLNDFETFRHYEKEYNELMSFIREYEITGIIFLSGDRHFSEIEKVQPAGMYPLYDITSSAFTSRPYSKFSETKEANNPNRVVPFAVLDQNYIRITISGDKPDERKAVITCYTLGNKTEWEYTIAQQDLRFK